ncbi:MAG: hypothetical protein M1821_000661 [Bathelium mastoideum]|nr:MAG: hypothetical protein M1821_000661 [Bathelium mastoideum]
MRFSRAKHIALLLMKHNWPWTRSNSVEGNWRPWELKRWWISVIFVIKIGLLITIIVLSVLSAKHNGFRRVSVHSFGNFLDVPVDSHILWGALPSFLISPLGLAFAGIIKAAADRQPQTILLDYATYPSIFNWAFALSKQHFHISAGISTQLLASLLLAPLMSNLFQQNPTQTQSSIKLRAFNGLNISALTEATDLQPAFDISSAINVYKAAPPVWMTPNSSFEPFYPNEGSVSGNVTFPTFAYFVDTDCESIARAELNPTYGGSDVQGTGTNVISFMDRNCSISDLQWPVTSEKRIYSRTWWQSCGDSQDPQDRIGVFTGAYSPTSADSLDNLTIISCWPKYWNRSVALTMAFEDGGPGQLGDVTLQNTSRIQSTSLRTLHSYLPEYGLSSPSSDLDSDSFGNVVHAYAQRLAPESNIDNDAYLNSTGVMYSTLFAALVTTQLIEPLQPPLVGTGTLATTVTRLYVVLPIAYSLITLLAVMTVCTVVIFVYVERTNSILQEEPQGLLGRAMVLLQGDVMEFVERVRERHPTERKLLEYVKKHYTVRSSKCWYEGELGPSWGSIRLTDLEEDSNLRPSSWQRILAFFSLQRRHLRKGAH